MTALDLSDIENLNREYSPSSCIDDICVHIQQYIDLSCTAKNRANALNALRSDLPYGNCKSQCLDIYLPTNNDPQQKLMVYIHGGYWQELSKEESCFAATNFQQQGFHFAVLDYTLAPNASIYNIVEENRKAIIWLYKNAAQFGYDPEEIYVSGSSAGAHLAMMMLQTNWSEHIAGYQGNIIKGLCAVSGIYDLQPLVKTYVNDAVKMDICAAKENSPALLPLPKPVPVIIAFGDIETDEFKRQSQMMRDKLQDNGFKVEFMNINQRNHFNVILDLGEKSAWLSQHTIKIMTSKK